MNIVSFYAPRRDHPFFQDYTPFLEILGESCKRYGHRHIVITDDPELARLPDCPGNAEFGLMEGFRADLPDNLMKAIIAGQLAYLRSDFAKEDTVLVGADCVLARDPLEVFEQEFDIAVTIGPFADCVMNTGAIYIRGNPSARGVTPIWERALEIMGEEWGDDQTALWECIRPYYEGDDDWTNVGGALLKQLPVDPYNLAPDFPDHDCTRGYILHFRGPRKSWMKDYCAKWLGIGARVEWRVLTNTDKARVFANVRENSKRLVPWLEETVAHDRHAVLVGGGASAVDGIDEIRERAASGQHVFALNGAGNWLATHGITPDYQVILDARPQNRVFLTGNRARHALLASQCDPSVFDVAHDRMVTLWHHAEDGITDHFEGKSVLIGGGITVGLTAMALVFALGYRNLHLYGYDSSDRDGEGHAYAQAEQGAEADRREIWLDHRCFTCSPAMYAQANAFPEFASMLADNGALITVHGDGLLPSIARKMAGLPI